jgi:hypothetical protein
VREGRDLILTGSIMANDVQEQNVSNLNHRGTYESFMAVTKWAVILVSAILILMAILLA